MGETKKTSRSALTPWKLLLVVVVGALLMTGCAVEHEVTFYEGERWEYVGQMSIPVAMIMPGMDDLLEGRIRELQVKLPGVEIAWRHKRVGENMVYHFTASGEGWENLNEVAFDGRAVITRENGKASFSYSILPLAEVMITSLTLHAGKIISSNADVETATSAIWHKPTGTMEAVLIEREPNGLGGLLIILGLLVVGAGGAAVLVKMRKQKFSKGRAAVTEAVCPQCGAANTLGDRFCQDCGAGLQGLTTLVITCPKCEAENPPEVKFCSQCGGRMASAQ